jgi:hypothetical protein
VQAQNTEKKTNTTSTDATVVFSYEIVILTSFIMLLYLTYYFINIERGKSSTRIESCLQGPIEGAVWVLPKKVRENESHPLWLVVKPSEDFTKRGSDENKSANYTSSDYLEAELQGVGLAVDGPRQVKILETSPLPVATWSCAFTKAGVQTINLLVKVVKHPNNKTQLLFMLNHEVHVASFLTISLAPIIALIGPILVVLVQVLVRH